MIAGIDTTQISFGCNVLANRFGHRCREVLCNPICTDLIVGVFPKLIVRLHKQVPDVVEKTRGDQFIAFTLPLGSFRGEKHVLAHGHLFAVRLGSLLTKEPCDLVYHEGRHRFSGLRYQSGVDQYSENRANSRTCLP